MEIIIQRGARFKLFDKGAYLPDTQTYMLAECHDKDYTYQIIRLDGPNVGCIVGYIAKDPVQVKRNSRTVTLEHLMKELHRNFSFDAETFKLLNE